MFRLTEYSGEKTVYGRRRAGRIPAALTAALAMALALTGCGLSSWEVGTGGVFGQTAEVADFGEERADNYSAEAPEDGEVAGTHNLN